MTITEPATWATDMVLAVAYTFWGRALLRAVGTQRSRRWWAGGFFAAALAAVAGGTVHGFGPYLGAGAEVVLWWLTLAAIGAFAVAGVGAAAHAGLTSGPRRGAIGAAVGLALVYGVWIAIEPVFHWAIVAYGSGLLVVGSQQLAAWVRRRARSAPWIGAGIVLAVAGAWIQQAEWGLHRHFNHNDVYHVFQFVGGWMFYRGGRHFVDRGAT